MELETKYQELERLTDTYYESKRQLEIYKTSLENHKYESEKIIQDLKERQKSEVDELVEENHNLHLKIEEQKDREQVR